MRRGGPKPCPAGTAEGVTRGQGPPGAVRLRPPRSSESGGRRGEVGPLGRRSREPGKRPQLARCPLGRPAAARQASRGRAAGAGWGRRKVPRRPSCLRAADSRLRASAGRALRSRRARHTPSRGTSAGSFRIFSPWAAILGALPGVYFVL